MGCVYVGGSGNGRGVCMSVGVGMSGVYVWWPTHSQPCMESVS